MGVQAALGGDVAGHCENDHAASRVLAHRVEGPWLEQAGQKNVSELTEDDWEKLRHELGK